MRLFLLPFEPQAHRAARRPGHPVTILDAGLPERFDPDKESWFRLEAPG